MQIAKLEAELGQKLFDRSVQGMTLTSAGEALVRLTAPIVRDAEYARQEMAQLGGRISGAGLGRPHHLRRAEHHGKLVGDRCQPLSRDHPVRL